MMHYQREGRGWREGEREGGREDGCVGGREGEGMEGEIEFSLP